MQVGSDIVVVAHLVNLRVEPGGEVKQIVRGDMVGRVLSGPYGHDNLTWWNVSIAGVTGWVAERTRDQTILIDDLDTTPFGLAMRFLLRQEGGVSTDRDDAGNWVGGRPGLGEFMGSKWGLTAANYPSIDLPTLTLSRYKAIMRADFWDRLGCDSRPWEMALTVFDMGVNAGTSVARTILEQATTADAFNIGRQAYYRGCSACGPAHQKRVVDSMAYVKTVRPNEFSSGDAPLLYAATAGVNLRDGGGGTILGVVPKGWIAYRIGDLVDRDEFVSIPVVAPCADGVWREGYMVRTYLGSDLMSPAPIRQLVCPVKSPAPITQLFGENPGYYSRWGLLGHNGIDIGLVTGSSVFAADDGVIERAHYDEDGYGNYVRIRHSWGQTIYAHLSRFHCYEGRPVRSGDEIGLSGNTGASTGPHLHLEMRTQGISYFDPLGCLRFCVGAGKLGLPVYAPKAIQGLFR